MSPDYASINIEERAEQALGPRVKEKVVLQLGGAVHAGDLQRYHGLRACRQLCAASVPLTLEFYDLEVILPLRKQHKG